VSATTSGGRRAPVFETYFDAARFPTVASVEQAGGFDPPEGGLDYNLQHAVDSFEFGLQRVLDGIDAFVRQRSTQSDQG
jgi:hypothetical protein